MLVDEHRASSAAAAGLSELLRKDLQRVIPGGALELSVAANHRPAIAIRIVETLESCLAAGAERAAIYRVFRIPLELDRASVTGLSDKAARDRAFATSRRIISGDSRYLLIGRDE